MRGESAARRRRKIYGREEEMSGRHRFERVDKYRDKKGEVN